MKIYSLILLMMMLSTNFVMSQQHNLKNTSEISTTYQITGKVIDQLNSLPVEFANVILHNAHTKKPLAYAMTDDSGLFSLQCNKTGDYYLAISFIGFKKFDSEVFSVTSEKSIINVGDIIIEPDERNLEEVVVTGRKRQIMFRLDRQVIDASEAMSANGGTAADILMQIPSVRMDADGEILLRGSAGFKVYIDGKPSSLGGAAALEQVPAGQIENLEILTTPSAKNNADGAAGIINIITKKTETEGWSGMVNLMGAIDKSRNLDFLLALRKKTFLWQLSGEASKRYVLSDFDQVKIITTDDLITTDHSKGDRERHTSLYYLRSSFDWYKSNTVWSAAFMGGYRDRWRGGALNYEDNYEHLSTGERSTSFFQGKDFVNLHEYQLRTDLGVEHNFPGKQGHKLTAALYGLYEGDAMEYFQTDLWDMQDNQAQGHKAWEDEYRFTGQINADYVYPFDNETGKFESGYQLYTYTEDGDYIIDMYDPEVGSFVERDELYNKYLFRRDIHAFYALVSDTYRRFHYQLGLRGEYTYRKLGNNLAWAQNSRHRFDLFPSVHVSFALDDRSRLQVAYSRRITQPELFYMEPYIVYVDYNTAQQGNPFIKPEYTNAVELGYYLNHGNNTFSATLFHRARRDKIERLRVPYQSTVTKDSMANVGNDYSTGIELSAALSLTRIWNMDANTSLYNYRIKNRFKVDEDEESWNWQLALNNNIDIAKDTRVRLEAYYVGPMVSTQGRVNGFFYLNLTARQQFLKRKLTATVVVRDLLSTAEYINKRSSIGLESLSKIYPKSPLFTLTLSYTFNNFKPQKKADGANHDLFEGTNR
jgi:outer membrane receptor protein involved in Fe transport